jgi:tellurite resistance protein
MKEIEELLTKQREETITDEERTRLRELLEKYGMMDQFQDQRDLNEEYTDRYSEKDENFAELPALEVINNLKNNEEESAKNQAEDN